MKKRILLFSIITVMTASLLSGCGGSGASGYSAKYSEPAYETEEAAYEDYADYDMYNDGEVYEYSASKIASNDNQISDRDIESNSNRKLIKTVNMSVETKEFDKLIDSIDQKIKELGGYAQNTDISGASYDAISIKRSAYIVARIPAGKLDSFVTYIDGEGNITSKSESAEDVTLQYSDVKARIESLKVEQTRLIELLAESENLDTIVALEARLTEVRYEIESYESRIRTMDDQVDYSTVNLNINEVKEYMPEPVEEPTFGERLGEEFIDGCIEAWAVIQDFIISFLSFLPMLIVILIILGVIGLIIFVIGKLVVKLVNKVFAKKKEKKLAKGVKAEAVARKADAKEEVKKATAVALDEKPEVKVENDNE